MNLKSNVNLVLFVRYELICAENFHKRKKYQLMNSTFSKYCAFEAAVTEHFRLTGTNRFDCSEQRRDATIQVVNNATDWRTKPTEKRSQLKLNDKRKVAILDNAKATHKMVLQGFFFCLMPSCHKRDILGKRRFFVFAHVCKRLLGMIVKSHLLHCKRESASHSRVLSPNPKMVNCLWWSYASSGQ